jgi:hypothetical protein
MDTWNGVLRFFIFHAREILMENISIKYTAVPKLKYNKIYFFRYQQIFLLTF